MAKAEHLLEWAEKRETKADDLHARNEPYTSDWAFITQPGPMPARARVIARADRAVEHTIKAQDFRRRAAGIEAAADRAIYSDDVDAVERLRARIAELEAQRAEMKRVNAEFRKAHKAELAALTPFQRDRALPHRGFELTNLGGNISRNRKRLAELEATR